MLLRQRPWKPFAILMAALGGLADLPATTGVVRGDPPQAFALAQARFVPAEEEDATQLLSDLQTRRRELAKRAAGYRQHLLILRSSPALNERAQKAATAKVLDALKETEGEWRDIRRQIGAALQETLPRDAARALEEALLQVEMEQSVNLMDQAGTYELLNKSLDMRGHMFEKAAKDLQALFEKDRKGLTGTLARVWGGKALAEIDDAQTAQARFEAAAADPAPQAAAARRQARYFAFLLPTIAIVRMPPKPTERQALAEQWLKDYADEAKSFEGQHLRLELAHLYREDGKVAKALALYTALVEEESVFQEAAAAGVKGCQP